jgi:hypothetical protein
MPFCFPSKLPRYTNKRDHVEWWSVYINLPCIFYGTEVMAFHDVNTVWKIEAPTGIKFEKNDGWCRFNICLLGFGVGYARQWGY